MCSLVSLFRSCQAISFWFHHDDNASIHISSITDAKFYEVRKHCISSDLIIELLPLAVN